MCTRFYNIDYESCLSIKNESHILVPNHLEIIDHGIRNILPYTVTYLQTKIFVVVVAYFRQNIFILFIK
jgi:hypothetical protein